MQKIDFIIAGGGASGLQLAHRINQHKAFAKASILILESNKEKVNDRTWCYWETGDGEWDSLLEAQWKKVQFKSPTYHKTIDLGSFSYKMLRSEPFYKSIRKELDSNNNIEIRYERCTDFSDDGTAVIVNTDKGKYRCSKLFTSIFDWKTLLSQEKYPVLQQHFVGWYIKTPQAQFDHNTAVFMDFTVAQKNNTRFMYVLPTSAHEALIEYTLFSKDILDKKEYEDAIRDYLHQKNITDFEIIEVEQGSIPMSCYPFSKHNSKNVHYIGSAGGWTKASTGFTFKNISQKTADLVEHLAANKPLTSFAKKNRFWWYDLLFLDVLAKHNHLGSVLFSQMFRKNKPLRIFKFLDEKSSVFQDIQIMRSFPTVLFIKQFVKRLFGARH
ncbi:MAG: lycopene cyclase family protein [Flavobacteriaceae bacterium]|jgi:lycopene beta-cyclase|nr:lycopene cyclase family protein [Flavobacteriaceae bacterium]